MNASEHFRFNFLYVDRYSFGHDWVFHGELVGFCMIRYILTGQAIFTIDEIDYKVTEGEVVYIPQDSYITSHTLSDTFSFYSIRFIPAINHSFGNILGEFFSVPTISKPCTSDIKSYFEKVYDYALSEKPMKMFKIRGYFELIISDLIEMNFKGNYDFNLSKPSTDYNYNISFLEKRVKSYQKIDVRIQTVVDYIHMHPNENYTLARLSEMADLSESQFRKLFKSQTGKTPNNFVIELKLVTAARKILISSQSISEVAYSIGFDDYNYFIRLFKKYFKQTPKKYKSDMYNI